MTAGASASSVPSETGRRRCTRQGPSRRWRRVRGCVDRTGHEAPRVDGAGALRTTAEGKGPRDDRDLSNAGQRSSRRPMRPTGDRQTSRRRAGSATIGREETHGRDRDRDRTHRHLRLRPDVRPRRVRDVHRPRDRPVAEHRGPHHHPLGDRRVRRDVPARKHVPSGVRRGRAGRAARARAGASAESTPPISPQ